MLKYYLPPDCLSRVQPPVQCGIGTRRLSSAGLGLFRGPCSLLRCRCRCRCRCRLARSAPPPIFGLRAPLVFARPCIHLLGTFPTFPLRPSVEASCCLRGGQTLDDRCLTSGIVVHKGHEPSGSGLVSFPYVPSARLAKDEMLAPPSQHANWIFIDNFLA